MNNKQHIEQYIQLHRDAFEEQECLPEYSWQALHDTLNRVKGDSLATYIASNRMEFDNEECPSGIWDNINQSLGGKHTTNDNLETFIRTNRAEFDTETPDLRVWEQLSTKKTPQLSISWSRQLIRSAAAIGLLIAGVGIGMWYSNQQQQRLAGMRMGDVSAEYAEIENHFERDIEGKKQQLSKFTSLPSSTDVFSDLSQMDKVMEELRLELANVPPGNREEVIRAMIENYKTKSKVLERVLKALEEHGPNDHNDDRNDQNSNNSDHENVRI